VESLDLDAPVVEHDATVGQHAVDVGEDQSDGPAKFVEDMEKQGSGVRNKR